MATSGFSLFAFSTASRPFMASPTTVQPRRAQRTPRMPRRTSSWSSATRIRSLFRPLLICGYRHAHCGAPFAGFNSKLAADLRRSLMHAGNADARPKRQFPILQRPRNSAAFVVYLQRNCTRVAFNSDLGLGTSRMPLDIRETFLNDPEKSQLDMWLQAPETRRYLELNFDSRPLRESARVMTNRILKSGFIQHRRIQQIRKGADLPNALIRQRLALRSELAQLSVGCGNRSMELAQSSCQRDKLLAGGVMQVSGDSPAFLLLQTQELTGKPLQLLLGALAVLNVQGYSVPLDDVSLLVAQRVRANQKPAIFSINAAQAHLILERFAGGHVR